LFWQLELANRRQLDRAQEDALVADLRQVRRNIELLVSAVDKTEARAFAQQLRAVLVKAGWAVPEVQTAATRQCGEYGGLRGNKEGTAVRRPTKARRVLFALQRVGIDATQSESAGLADRTVLILVGRRR
jgi:hypothetical protein